MEKVHAFIEAAPAIFREEIRKRPSRMQRLMHMALTSGKRVAGVLGSAATGTGSVMLSIADGTRESLRSVPGHLKKFGEGVSDDLYVRT